MTGNYRNVDEDATYGDDASPYGHPYDKAPPAHLDPRPIEWAESDTDLPISEFMAKHELGPEDMEHDPPTRD